ncbi:MAG: chromate transporter [Brevinema sp.]
MVYYDIFISFLKTGLTTFGGGPAAIPVLREESVNHYGWLSETEFIDVLAFGNSLPGPIATKLAAFIGYKAGGLWGSTIALIATVLPTAILMILMYSVYYRYRDTAWMKGMLLFVKPVVFILILDICVNMRGIFNSYQALIIAILAALGLYLLKLHPATLIVSSLILGIFLGK